MLLHPGIGATKRPRQEAPLALVEYHGARTGSFEDPFMTDSTTVWTARTLADRLTTTTRTIRAWTRAGLIPPPIKIGPRRLVWRAADIEKFLAEGGTPGLHRKKPGRPRKAGGAV